MQRFVSGINKLAPMQKTMRHLKICFFSTIILLLGQYSIGQTIKRDSTQTAFNTDTSKISGNYEGVICFRSSECLTTKLLLKNNHEYIMKRLGNNHGMKNKSTKHGTWVLDGEILILKQSKTKDNKDVEPEKYKIIKSDLWYYSSETFEPTEIALKRK